jgi:hypothetical protein
VPAAPLSVDLSRLLVAFTIELDNEFEHRMEAALRGHPFRVGSLVMWSNFLRFVGDGIAVGELPRAAGLPKARVLSTFGGMERWGYVWVAPPPARKPPAERRDGYGSARALKADWVVRPARAGAAAQEIWPALFPEIEARWRSRFGAKEVAEVRAACLALREAALPEYLPVVVGANGMVTEIEPEGPQASAPVPLSALVAQTLLAYTLAFEREAPLSLPLLETVVRALGEGELVDVRELPAAAAISPEAVAMALTYLVKAGLAAGKRSVRITEAGLAARDAARAVHAQVERAWRDDHGREALARLRAASSAVVDQRDGSRSRLALGLEPYPDGWRASGRYRVRTDAVLADPSTGLPRHPLVLPRGGWPDGS